MSLPTARTPKRCPCGSGAPYADCCGALHRGSSTGATAAATAEALMRSRYSAFAVGDAAYLLATWDPSTRPASLELDPALEWRRLEVVRTTAGGEDDREGTVAFVAHFWEATHGQLGLQQEDSAFRRRGGRWFYIGPVAP